MCSLRQGGDAQIEKKLIRSWGLILSFSAIFGPRNGREAAIHPTKNMFFVHFEARELSYPIMTFPGNFGKVQNLESSVLGAPLFFKCPGPMFEKKMLREPGSKQPKIRPPGDLRNRLMRP